MTAFWLLLLRFVVNTVLVGIQSMQCVAGCELKEGGMQQAGGAAEHRAPLVTA